MNAPGPRDPASCSAEELADPSIDPTTLRRIAAARPDLWRLARKHPNCDRELAEYIDQRTSSAAPPQRPPAGTQPPPGVQQPPGTQPPPSPPQPGGRPPQAAQQSATGSGQTADGAKAYFTNTVAPGATSMARAVRGKSGLAPGRVHWTTWFRFALPVIALVGIISLSMPLASVSAMGHTESVNYFSEGAPDGEGVAMFVLFLLVIGFSVVSLLTGKKWAVITTGVIAVIVGIFSTLNGFGTSAAISGERFDSVGAGAILLGIVGIALIVTAIVTMLPKQRTVPQQAFPQQHGHPQQPYPPQPFPPQHGHPQQPYPPQQQQGPPHPPPSPPRQ